ncbi:MAG: type I-D CRISPR-associated protein Cas10d/Csc3 [Chloroflexi bacterium]|nr:type I-D CRISPR-associated protein Cas10d/Csc3 [Chloroflexota bacterium]MCI0581070.1 type I-D CRISPR-associated protein Cas10d/Csc3 [Chloroflexota bacterium]MCI0649466.1 type I-D CRISPR-associated protein Cas10d/Csc3 [Chloroflexota bacterium]MCI0731863.1 type I-D CRISPR-associated protein Cas10d/Csc3 [Chloroflexota bacterium]
MSQLSFPALGTNDEPEFVDVEYEEPQEEEAITREPALADEPLFSWLLREAVQRTVPGDLVLLDYVTHVAQPLSEHLALKPAKGGQEFIAARLAEGKTAADVARYQHEQSLRAHLINGLLPVAHIGRILHRWAAPRFKYWDDTVYRLFCVGYTLHDWVKLPQVETELQAHGLGHDSASAARHLPVFESIFRQWSEKLGLATFLAPIGGLDRWLHDVIYLAVNTQVRWGTMLNLGALPNLRLNGRARQLATDLCTLADRIAYLAKTPIELPSSPAIAEPISNLSDGAARLIYHHLAENRGVLTNFIQNAALAAMQSDECIPLLFAPSGVVYLSRQERLAFPSVEQLAEATIRRIRQACGGHIRQNFVGFSRDGKGLKTAPYYTLHLTPAEQIRLAARAVFSQIADNKKPSAGKRFAKIADKGWLSPDHDLGLPDDIRVDQLGEFCALAVSIAKAAAPNLVVDQLLLDKMGLSGIRLAFEELVSAKNTGGTPYQWYYAAGYYLAHGAGRGQDPAQWRQTLENLGEELAQAVVANAGGTGQQNDGWDDARAYIKQVLSFGPVAAGEIGVVGQVAQELLRYQGAKRKGRKATTVCSLCSSAYTVNPQREAGILFAPQVYTNKQLLHGAKAIRHICQICETEMMLRQILMNRGGSTGKRFEGRKFRYLYLYPTYFFTPETLTQLRYIHDRLQRISFTSLRKALQAETDSGPQLQLEALALQRLQDLMMTPEPPQEDRLFRLHFPEGDPITMFFIGMPPPGRDAKDAEAWVNPAWLALLLPLVVDVKVVATESPLPLLQEADELAETVFFDAPHDFVSALVGRERIPLDQLLPRLQALTVAYMVHMDGNADFSKGDYRWHVVPLLARRLAENSLWAAAYLKKWQRSQNLDSIPADRAHLYLQYIQLLATHHQMEGGMTMTHARQLTELYRQFYRHQRPNSNSILRPIAVVSRAILDADPRLFSGREGLSEAVRGALHAFMSRVESGTADGRLAVGSTRESRETAMKAFADYFVGEIYFDVLNGDASALQGKQLNLLKNACEVIYRDEEAKYWRERSAAPHAK